MKCFSSLRWITEKSVNWLHFCRLNRQYFISQISDVPLYRSCQGASAPTIRKFLGCHLLKIEVIKVQKINPESADYLENRKRRDLRFTCIRGRNYLCNNDSLQDIPGLCWPGGPPGIARCAFLKIRLLRPWVSALALFLFDRFLFLT